MTTLNEYNLRQFDLLIKSINDFEGGKLSLSSLISNIEGLIGALENFSLSQRNELIRKWGVLDEIFAVCLDENNRSLSKEERDLINHTLCELRELCFSLMGKHESDKTGFS